MRQITSPLLTRLRAHTDKHIRKLAGRRLGFTIVLLDFGTGDETEHPTGHYISNLPKAAALESLQAVVDQHCERSQQGEKT